MTGPDMGEPGRPAPHGRPGAALAVDEAGSVVEWTDAAEAIFGWAAGDVLGRNVGELLTPAAASADGHREPVGDGTGPGTVTRLEMRARHGQGRVFPATVTVWPDDTAPGPPRYRMSIDTTPARGRLDGDPGQRPPVVAPVSSPTKTLEAALGQARASEARYRQFTADVAHQLCTPMAGIRACAETLLDDPPLEVRDALLLDVVREADRTGKLVRSLLELARMDQAQLLVFTRCDIAGLCAEELDRARVLAPNLDHALTVHDLGDPPKLDGHAVREILANLLDNARRHATTRITLDIRRTGRHIEISVRDDGPGVPPHLTERIFDRFMSGDGQGGTGLGLPIARGLARSHGGDLTYTNQAFTLHLPAKAHRHCGGAGAPDYPPTDSAGGWGPWLTT